MALARVNVVLQGVSGLPEDQFVNTLAWNGDGLPDWDSWAQDLADAVRTLWQQLSGTGSPFYPNDTVARSFQVRVYNPEDAGAPPMVATGTLPFNTSLALPTECAAVLSFYAGSNRPRQRGRIFVGPMSTQSLLASGRMATDVITRLTTLATGLKAFGGDSYQWSVYSRVDDVHRELTAGWVDNAFDTQRRRGLTSNVRTPFTLP